jgi:hypothetical protein
MQVTVAFEGEVTSMFETCPRPHSLKRKVTINYPNTTQERRCEIGFSVTSKRLKKNLDLLFVTLVKGFFLWKIIVSNPIIRAEQILHMKFHPFSQLNTRDKSIFVDLIAAIAIREHVEHASISFVGENRELGGSR